MAEAGWFQDRQDPRRARWWDGERWTEHTLVIADQPRGVRPPPPGTTPARQRPRWGDEPAEIPAPTRFAERTVPLWVAVTLAVVVVALLGALLTSDGTGGDAGATSSTVPAGTVRTPDLQDRVPTADDVDLLPCAPPTQATLPAGLTVVRAGAVLSASHLLLAAELDGPPRTGGGEAGSRRLALSFEVWEPVGDGGYEALYAFAWEADAEATGSLVDSERHRGEVVDPSAIAPFAQGDLVGVVVERDALPLLDEAGPSTFAVDAEPQVRRSGWVPSGDPQICPTAEDTGRITRLEDRRS